MKNLIAAIGALALTLAVVCAMPAHAANCSSYTYTLTNGQVADANQVMANLNNILSCGNNNLAKNGANTDITSLGGLLTPLSASQGGTGLATSIFATANTWTVNQTFATSTTSIPSINIPPGVAPTVPTNGDIWATSTGVFARVAGVTYSMISPPVMQVQYQLASGTTSPETFTSASGDNWTSRLLNTSVINNITGASLASNQITLPAGTYKITVTACVVYSDGAVTRNRLYNVTDAAATLYGLVGHAGGVGTSCPLLTGQFTLASAKALRVDSFSDGAGGTGGGPSGMTGVVEMYTDVYIEKIG